MRIAQFRLTRFQFARDRVIGDSQVRADDVNCAALEITDDAGRTGLGFLQTLFTPLPALSEIERIFSAELWPGLEGVFPQSLIHRVSRPRGGNQRAHSLPFGEALQVALWDLAAKQAGLPLHVLLGARRDRVRAYASGLDFHLDDGAFQRLFAHAAGLGYRAFKIKVGHADFAQDLHRMELLTQVIPAGAQVMIDANEAWAPQEAARKLAELQKIHPILWAEDPVLRHDFEGLRLLRQIAGTQVNSGEYLDVQGKRLLLQAGGADLLNVHGHVTDVMRIGWLAAEMGVPVTMGNTFLEIGVHMAAALPEVEWLEYSFQNFDHLVDEPIRIADGFAHAPDRPGHGLVLSETARRDWARPEVLPCAALGPAPANPRLPI